MRNIQKREGRKILAPLKRALSTAVLAAGLAVLPSCATAPKSKMAVTVTKVKVLKSKKRGDAESKKALNKVRSLKGTAGDRAADGTTEQKKIAKETEKAAGSAGLKDDTLEKMTNSLPYHWGDDEHQKPPAKKPPKTPPKKK